MWNILAGSKSHRSDVSDWKSYILNIFWLVCLASKLCLQRFKQSEKKSFYKVHILCLFKGLQRVWFKLFVWDEPNQLLNNHQNLRSNKMKKSIHFNRKVFIRFNFPLVQQMGWYWLFKLYWRSWTCQIVLSWFKYTSS